MSHLDVIVLNTMEEASRLRADLNALEKQGALTIQDATILVKDQQGNI